jgi:hypothetical protein
LKCLAKAGHFSFILQSMKIKTLLIASCAFLLSASDRGVEVIYKAPIEGLGLDRQLYVQSINQGYAVISNTEVAMLDGKHRIAWQFKPRTKGQHGISSFCETGDGGIVIGGWEKASHGKQAWLVKLNNAGQKEWDASMDPSEQVLAIAGSSKGFYVLTVDATAERGRAGRRVRFYDGKGMLRSQPNIEVDVDFTDDVTMFVGRDSSVTIFGGTARNTLEAVRLGLGRNSSPSESIEIEKAAFYRKLRGFVNFIVIENVRGGYYAAYTAIGAEASADDYRFLTFDNNLKLLKAKDFGGDDSDGLSSMTMDKAGNLALAGYSYSGVSRDKSEPAFEKNHCDVWIIKIDAEGNKLWDKTITGPGCIFQARVFNKGDQTWVVFGEESKVMVAVVSE